MKLTSIAASIGLVLGAQLACAVGGPRDMSTASAGFVSTPVAGGFVDAGTFTLAAAGTRSAIITSVLGGTQGLDFIAIHVTGPSGVFSFTQLMPALYEPYVLGPVAVAAGDYTLSLIGTDSASIGSYGGNRGANVVPDPQPYPLLVAGMVGIGFFASRRRE